MPSKNLFLTAIVCLAFAVALAADTPLQWAQDPHRNVVVPAEDLPDHLGDDNRVARPVFFASGALTGFLRSKKVAIFRKKCQNYGHYPIVRRGIWAYTMR